MSTFGAVLRRARASAGLSQEALAERARLSVSAIAALERGRRTAPRPATVALLAQALGLSPAERDALSALASERSGHEQPESESEPASGSGSGSGSGISRSVANRSLPSPPTLLFGREAEVARVAELLRPPVATRRLVTLIGPGGVGKTRLALAVASVVQSTYRDGVLFIDFAALREHRLVSAAMARALGIREEGGQSARDLLIAHLRDQQVLLVLDNLEQLLGAAPLLSDLLAACPDLALLATSRAALRLRSEQRFVVPALASAPAVQLFVDRAQAVAPEFVIDATNVASIAAICRRLDGLPLAIELAAARSAVLPADALLKRLDRALPLLTDGASDLPTRQRTLQTTIDWSYGLLPAPEQALLRCLSVFRGGCSLEAVEAVARGSADAARGDLLEELQMLIDHSLVVSIRAPSGQTRFSMLETIREYGQLQLEATGELQPTSRAHADFYLELAQTARAHLFGVEQLAWLSTLEDEHDNCQEALAHAVRVGDVEAGLQLAAALWRFWYLHCYLTTAHHWLGQVLALPTPISPSGTAARLDVLVGLACIFCSQTNYTRTAEVAEEGVALARQLGDQLSLAMLIDVQAVVARNQNDLRRATDLGLECVAIARRLGDDWTLALALHNLADVARIEGAFQRAAELASESLAVATRMDDRWGVVQSQLVLGWIAHDRGDFAAAAIAFAACFEAASALGHTRDTARALAGMGEVALAQGHLVEADELLRRGETEWRRLGDVIRLAQVLVMRGRLARVKQERERAIGALLEAFGCFQSMNHVLGMAESLEALAGVLAIEPARAEPLVRLIAQASALRERIGAPPAPAERARYAQDLDAAAAQLGQDAFNAAWASGRLMSLDEALALVH